MLREMTGLVFGVFVVVARAQTPSFEVASIKPNVSAGGISSIHLTAGRVSMQNVSLKKVMLNAYGIPDDREYMIEGPNWLVTEHFDIDATFNANSPASQVQQMLQGMLAERFKLTLHRETKQLPIYSLTVAKNGPKIHPVEEGQARTSGGNGHFTATKITMQKFADLLARQAGLPVVDATGLKGVFDFTLDWSPAADIRMPTAEPVAAVPDGKASLFTALQEQIGLKLESGKGPVEILVVDHMEKTPTEN
jgi:uncharacterized protein (TIGR03435 family)